MHVLAIVLLAAAGLAYCAAAAARWRALARPAPDVDGAGLSYPLKLKGAAPEARSLGDAPCGAPPTKSPWLWLGFGAHTLALVIALADPAGRDFAYVVLAVWAALAALLFARGFLSGPSRSLLALPVGAMALLVAMLGAGTSAAPPSGPVPGAVTALHIAFMVAYLAAVLVAGAAGGLYLAAGRQLKSASPRAFALPALPVLELLSERALVLATALLLGGLATGGAAIGGAPGFRLGHPTAVLGLTAMAMMVVILALRLAGRLRGSRLASAAVAGMALGVLGFLSLEVAAHG
jgi:hypothetical protein